MSQQQETVSERDGQELFPMLQGFRMNRQLTYDLLESLTEADLTRKWPRPGLDTFSKQFQEMAAVQNAFIGALSTGVMDFSPVPDVHAFTDITNKDDLVNLLRQADQQFEEVLKNKVRSSVRWDDIDIPAQGHLGNLISHEVFHQGQMLMAVYTLELTLPDSWVTNWAVPAGGVHSHG